MQKNKNIIGLVIILSTISSIKSTDNYDEKNNHKTTLFMQEDEKATKDFLLQEQNDTINDESIIEKSDFIPNTTDVENTVIMATQDYTNFNDNNEKILEENIITNEATINLFIESTETHIAMTISDEPTTEKQNISLDEGIILLQDVITNIQLRTCINDEDDNQKTLTPSQKQTLSTIIGYVINTVATNINIIHENQYLLEKEDGVALLQTCINNLTTGSKFTLNGITYTIID